MIANPGVFWDSVARMYYDTLKDFEDCKKVYEKAMEVYPEYKSVFQQHLDVITGNYQANK